jgi:nucleotide-binding universal stress UspA family protein
LNLTGTFPTVCCGEILIKYGIQHQPGKQAGRESVMKIKKILNPIDGSDHSIRATEYAIELARLLDAEIILLHCHARFPIVLAEPYFQQAINEINKASEELVEPFIKILEQDEVKFEVRILEGTPGNKIPEVAGIEKIDLIVMGSRGVTDFAGLFLGSVAHQILHKSECPVFIAK